MKTKDYFEQALKEAGMENGVIGFNPPAAGKVIRRYQELLAEDRYQLRNNLINRFIDLNLGDLPEIETMPLDQLEELIDDLEQALASGKLDLETKKGIDALAAIVTPYLD